MVHHTRSLTASGFTTALLALLLTLVVPIARADQAGLDAELTPVLKQYRLPALAAAVVKEGRIVAAGAVGTRRAGEEIPVTLDDRFHIGSDTKAMTALLAAMYVEQGKLRWNSTPGEIFPELAATMDAGFRDLTLEQLLSHTSGLVDDEQFGKVLERSLLEASGNLDEIRYWMVAQWCRQPLGGKPGSFNYSNMGYTVAGAMIERVAGRSWDELIVSRIFEPLGLRSAGLGPQASLGRIDAPLGHLPLPDGKLKPFLAGPNGDNPPEIGPAGIAHLSVLDFARWAGWNAGEGKRGPALVKPETLRKLHTPVVSMPEQKEAPPGTPPGGRYGLGWGMLPVAWADVPLLYHGGSNTKNLAHIWVEPGCDFAMVLMTNVGGPQAEAALRGLAERLYREYSGAACSRLGP